MTALTFSHEVKAFFALYQVMKGSWGHRLVK